MMKTTINILWLLLLVSINTITFAQDFNDVLRLSETGIDAGARALGMGNAYTALSNDFSGTSFNPAGLGLVKRFEMTGSIDHNNFDNSSLFNQSVIDYSSSVIKLNEFGAVFPLPTKRGSMVFSFGYNIVKNFNSAAQFEGFNNANHSMIQRLTGPDDLSYWLFLTDESGLNTPISGQLLQYGDIRESGKLGCWKLAGAVEVAENTFVGASLDLFSGTYKRDRQFVEEDVNNVYDMSVLTDPLDEGTADFNKFFLNDIIDWKMEGWSAKLGLTYIVNDMSTLGFTIKLPTTFKIEENYFVDAYSEFNTGLMAELDPPISNITSYELCTPVEFSAGHALHLGPVLLISTDVAFIDYTQMEMKEGLSPAAVSQINRDIDDLFDSVVKYNLGVEFKIPDTKIALRGGYFYSPSPYKDDPSDFDKKFLTAGVGVGFNGPVSLDFTFVTGWWKNYEDNYSYGDNVSRVLYDITVQNMVLTFTYRIFK